MTAQPQSRFDALETGYDARPVRPNVRSVRRPQGRVRRVTRVLVPRRLRRRLGKIHDRIQAQMHIASRA